MKRIWTRYRLVKGSDPLVMSCVYAFEPGPGLCEVVNWYAKTVHFEKHTEKGVKRFNPPAGYFPERGYTVLRADQPSGFSL